MLKEGFYIVRSTEEDKQFAILYKVHRLMEDEDTFYASAGVAGPGSVFDNSWIFRRNVNDALIDNEKVGETNVNKFLKFKWWLWNKLVSSGVVADAKQIRRKGR
jgi:hypothetical protein